MAINALRAIPRDGIVSDGCGREGAINTMPGILHNGIVGDGRGRRGAINACLGVLNPTILHPTAVIRAVVELDAGPVPRLRYQLVGGEKNRIGFRAHCPQ